MEEKEVEEQMINITRLSLLEQACPPGFQRNKLRSRFFLALLISSLLEHSQKLDVSTRKRLPIRLLTRNTFMGHLLRLEVTGKSRVKESSINDTGSDAKQSNEKESANNQSPEAHTKPNASFAAGFDERMIIDHSSRIRFIRNTIAERPEQ
jgi:hypothetical protein